MLSRDFMSVKNNATEASRITAACDYGFFQLKK